MTHGEFIQHTEGITPNRPPRGANGACAWHAARQTTERTRP